MAFNYFHDILWNLDFTEENIDLERSTILGEANGGNFRPSMYSSFMEKKITGWGAKLPKDYEDHIKTFEPKKIRNFYNKWYRPDLMAIVVIGDLDDMDEIEKKIIKKFSKGKRPDNTPHTAVDQISYLKKAPQFYKKELKGDNDHLVYKPTPISLYFRQSKIEKVNNDQRLKDQLVRSLFIELLNNRYLKELREYNIFLSIRSKFLAPPSALRIEIAPEKGLNQNVFINVFKPLMKIKKYGFTAEEFKDGKIEYLKSIRKTDSLGISYWRNQIIEHFVNGETLPEGKTKILENILQNLTKEEFNDEIKKYIKEEPEDISIVGYRDTALDSSERKIRTWIKELESLPIDPPVTNAKKLVLMDTSEIEKLKEAPVKILKTKIPEAKSYELKNGLRVIFKSTPPHASNEASDQNTINFRGFSPQGINCFSKRDYFSAFNTPSVLKNSGIGELDKFELKEYLKRKEFDGYISPFVESDASGLKGKFALRDLETAFQMMSQHFKSPNFSNSAFEDWKTQQKINIAYMRYPADNFETAIKEFLPNENFTPKGRRFIEGLEQTDLERIKRIHSQIFNDAGSFTFLFSGEFNEEVVLKLCQKYLGTLPAKSKTSKCIRKNKDSLNEPLKSRTFYSTAPLKLAMVRIAYIKKTEATFLDWKEDIKLDILRRSLAELLIRRMRFESKDGGTYQILALRDHSSLYKYHGMCIDFDSYPEDTERLIEESKNVVKALKKDPIENSLLENLKKIQLNIELTHGNIIGEMYGIVKNGETWIDKDDMKAFIESLNPKDIQATAAKYLKNKPVIFKMLPKEFKK